jgi:hypothetical protein
MKIVVIAPMRSRATWFLTMLSSHYGLKWIDAPYGIPTPMTGEFIQSVTDKLINDDDFVTKIESTELYNDSEWFGLNPFKIEQYDQVFTLYRSNLSDIACSLYLVKEFDTWHYSFKNNQLPKRNLETRTLDFKLNHDLLTTVIKQDQAFKKALAELTVPHIDLTYDNVIEYAETNLPKGRSDYVDSKYDYTKIFSNYNYITEYLNEQNNTIRL